MIAEIVSAVTDTIQIAGTLFDALNNVGCIIVYLVITIFVTVSTWIKGMITVITIFLEDNEKFFTHDFPIFFMSLISSPFDIGVNLVSLCYDSFAAIGLTIMSLCENARWTIENYINFIFYVIQMLKVSLILLGNTLWYIITFVPYNLPLFIKHVFTCIIDNIIFLNVKMYSILKNIVLYITDVPVQSLLGLVITIITVRILIVFQADVDRFASTLRRQLVFQFWGCYFCICEYFTPNGNNIISFGNNFNMNASGDSQFETDRVANSSQDNILCVVCKERLKCEIIFPCKHLCLCQECLREICRISRLCPICRVFIVRSLHVYI